ncbi:TIGR03086 family metal-binding protein [Streptomyces sp. NBC_00059]|uniref:TIGR03086 family metal-binding protein n=1 Tax=Streptomyces sp. NBC_00059 TaxID=2975635 RepID=UPI0022569CBF|nr:TIGR03086 family metal-binding protein [Streptomyces sp. NBC_00059]MCX5417578.1 TIGR03086 family metal-binding protein [Streptomyces sp. NBC_00059]
MELTGTPADIVLLDRIAVLESVRVVDEARPGDWLRPTPCDRWTLRELVEHMAAQHHGFAAASRGEGADAAAWRRPDLGDDPAGAYRTAAKAVLDAFASPGLPERPFALPEISARPVPALRAVGFHFIDYVAHAWDVATALGLPVRLPEPVLREALPIALAVPDGDVRRAPGAAFRPGLPVDRETRPDGHGTLSLILAVLGRSSDWTPPRGA